MMGPEIKRRLGALDALIFSAFHHEAINTRLSLELNKCSTITGSSYLMKTTIERPPSDAYNSFSRAAMTNISVII